MIKSPDRWVLCPICGNKTRTKIRPDTILENFPLFCPKCKQETLISAKDLNVAVIPVSYTHLTLPTNREV